MIVTSKPIGGREFHLYNDTEKDKRSICNRAPLTGPTLDVTKHKPTCAVCLRALNAILKYKVKEHAL